MDDVCIFMSFPDLLELLSRAYAGEDPEEILREYYASLIEDDQDVLQDEV